MKKTALITGSSRGIGRAIAIKLAQDGYKVFVHGTSISDKILETKNLIEKNGGLAEIITADLCDTDDTKNIINKTGNIDALILNASIQIRSKWKNISLDDAYKQLNCNFISSLLLIQSAVPYMKEKQWGRIITIGSVQEAKPHPDMLIYSAGKAAQTNMVKSLSLQLAKDGITVNNVAPGVIYTDRNSEALADTDYAKKVIDSIPAGFYGTPSDCTGIVSLLCSDEGRYITGQNIFVDGGKSL